MEARVSLVVAMAFDRVIGAHGQLPWRLPEDLRRFRALTLGHPVVMGRKTFASIGRALPGRTNFVVTRQAGFAAEGVVVARSPDDALAQAIRLDGQVAVIGGAEVFQSLLPRAASIEATFVYAEVPGDVRFPRLDPGWHVQHREDFASPPVGTRTTQLLGSFVRLDRHAGEDACALCQGLGPGGTAWDAGFARLLRDLASADPHVHDRDARWAR